MSDEKKSEPNGHRPVRVVERGCFTVVTGDREGPHYQRVNARVANRRVPGIGPAQYFTDTSSSSQESIDSGSLTQSLSSQSLTGTGEQPEEPIPSSSAWPPPRALTQSCSSPSLTATQPEESVPSSSGSRPRTLTQSRSSPSLIATQPEESVPSSSCSPARTLTQSRSSPSLTATQPRESGTDSEPGSGHNRSLSGPPFASLSMAFFSSQPQQTPSLQVQTPQFQFQPPQQQLQFPQMQMQLQVPQPQILLYTKEKAPAGWSTKFEDLHQDSQKVLLQIEYVSLHCLCFVFTVRVLGFRVLDQILVSSTYLLLFHGIKTASLLFV